MAGLPAHKPCRAQGGGRNLWSATWGDERWLKTALPKKAIEATSQSAGQNAHRLAPSSAPLFQHFPPARSLQVRLRRQPESKLILEPIRLRNTPPLSEPVTETLRSVPTFDVTFCGSRRSVIE
jgi:hypothetical protein